MRAPPPSREVYPRGLRTVCWRLDREDRGDKPYGAGALLTASVDEGEFVGVEVGPEDVLQGGFFGVAASLVG